MFGSSSQGEGGSHCQVSGMAGAWVRAGGQPQLYGGSPLLSMDLMLCGPCSSHIPTDPTRTDI